MFRRARKRKCIRPWSSRSETLGAVEPDGSQETLAKSLTHKRSRHWAALNIAFKAPSHAFCGPSKSIRQAAKRQKVEFVSSQGQRQELGQEDAIGHGYVKAFGVAWAMNLRIRCSKSPKRVSEPCCHRRYRTELARQKHQGFKFQSGQAQQKLRVTENDPKPSRTQPFCHQER